MLSLHLTLLAVPWAIFAVIPVLVVTYWIGWIIYARTLHPLSRIPGPFLASVSRLWVVLQLRRGDMEVTQRALHQKYGPLLRIAPNEIAVASPSAIRQIYPIQRPLTKTDFYDVWGNPTFSKYKDHFVVTDEKLHSERRRIVNNVYSMTNVLKSEEYIDRCSNMFIEKLDNFAAGGVKLDLGHWLQMYAFDVIGELYFGRMFGFMEKNADHGGWIHSLDSLIPAICTTAVSPTYVRRMILGSAFMSTEARQAQEALRTIDAAARACVDERLQEQTAGGSERSRRDILQQLFDTRAEKGAKLDFGIDTTAIAMRSVFYYLLRSPPDMEALLQELIHAYAEGRLTVPVKYSDAIKLPLLCACIKEAMRLHPSVALTMPRLVPEGGMELNGQYIPAGYRVGMNAAVVHYDATVFGLDADQYRPRRWLEENAANMDRHMMQFGAGTRTCIGKNISLSELHKLIPQILLSFEITLVGSRPWKTNNMWFNKQTGLEVRLKRRKLSVEATN